MELYIYILVFLATLTLVASSTYHPVSFISQPAIRPSIRHSSYSTVTIHNRSPPINRRSFRSRSSIDFVDTIPQIAATQNRVWKNGIYFATSPINGATVEIGRGGHLTPDFSNGLDYPDPFLLTGITAQATAKLLYSHELFFSDYPHVSAVLRNQEERRANGLEGHKLGSIRPQSPFYRYRFEYQFLS